VNLAVKLSWPATRDFWEIPVLFEDDHLFALDKPAGLLTSPDRLAPDRPSLMQLVHAGIAAGKPWARERNLVYLANAHRLDFETSGVLLLARNKPALVALADQFGSEQTIRNQIALVQGVPPDDSFVVAEKLAPHPLQPGRMRIDSRNGKKSITEFAVLERFSRWSLLRCRLRQERAQQIPLHLSHAGFPVVGDELNGGKKLWLSRLKRDFYLKPGREERPLISRAALHVEELNLVHPVTQQPLSIKSEWPKDLRVALKYLRQYGKSLS
jgi:23S rRNA pseudouridine955/2504/2580 synthase/23S rRNA pseudouridine1911/1915/1917 synthase